MKKTLTTTILSLVVTTTFAQLNWQKGGNNAGPPGSQPIIGTDATWNAPLLFHTNGINRVHVNQNKTPTINAFNVNTSGYIGIGNPTYGPTLGNTPFFSTKGPFSLLHLNGLDGGGQEFGYRPWMQTGVTFTEGFDLSYVGNRVINATNDINEFTLAWSNDPTNPQFGPDDMVFRFLSGRAPGAGGSTISSNYSAANDLDGLHVARFTGTGLMGLGNTFGLTQDHPNYIRPQSLLHMSLDNVAEVWMQITNRLGTDQTVNDGLRLGMEVGANPSSYLRWQERTPFIVQTDWDATAGGIANGERMRISSIGANGVPLPFGATDNNITRVAISHRGNSPITSPRSLLHLGYNTGNGAPGTFITDGWRDWMDIGTFTNNGTDNIYVGLKNEGVDRFDAVINWGDNQVAGTTPNGPDNLRFIFTSTTTALPPGQGDPVSQSNDGLETARIMPTAATTMGTNFGMMGIGNWTTAFNTLPANVINAKLDIDGDLRIRTVTEDTTLLQVLVIDSTDHNRVHWRNVDDFGSDDQNLTLTGTTLSIEDGNSVDLSSLDTDTDQQTLSFNGSGELCISGGNCVPLPPGGGGTVTANNGLHVFGSNNVRLGGSLVENTTVDLNNFSLNFSNTGRIGINGFANSKLAVVNDSWANVLLMKSSIAANNSNLVGGVFAVNNTGFTTISATNSRGLTVNAFVNDPGWNVNTEIITIADPNAANSNAGGVQGLISRISGNVAGRHFGVVSSPTNFIGGNIAYHTIIREDNNGSMLGDNVGLNAVIQSSGRNWGARINSSAGIIENYGVDIIAGALGSSPNQNNAINYGIRTSVTGGNTTYGGKFHASSASNKNYGIYASVGGGASGNNPPLPTQQNFAGYFSGDVYITGSVSPSDIMLKNNVNNIDNATDIINQLNPKTFDYKQADFPTMNLSQGLQYGLIAQDVETILPELITNVTQPAELDSLGNIVTPEISFKGLEYQQLIPILIAGMKEQQQTISNLQSTVEDLKNCLSNANICTEGHRTMNTEPSNNINNRSVELVNTNSIILDQNLPNPFKENTVINYNIPAEVSEAKLLFYDLNGRIIKELIIEERGESKLTVYGTNLKTGIYTYSLIADGELIATKKMVKK